MHMSKSYEYALNNKDYTVKLRRHFHMHPELSFKEFETSAFICKELDKFKIPYEMVSETGIVATFKGKSNSPVIGVRADMDALPITETNDVDYISKNPGVMHACGHDGHMAILLTLAKYVSEHKDEINPTIKFIFQPAEEIIAGAKKIILNNTKIFADLDQIIALHLWNDFPCGKISVEAGPRMASSDTFTIKVIGKMGHGSMPHQAIDSIYIASNLVTLLQGIVSRETNSLEPIVVSIGTFNAGSAPNVVAGEAYLSGTVRCFTNELRSTLKYKMERIVKNITKAYDADYEFAFYYGTPPVVNTLKISEQAANAVRMSLGDSALSNMQKVMGGEDFAHYLENLPGCLAFVGSGKSGSFPHHHDKFDIAEESLIYGVAYFIQYIMNILSEG